VGVNSFKMAAEEKYKVKQFKDSNIDFWVNYQHYRFENKEIKFIAGGDYKEEAVAHLTKYLKTKKLL